MKMTKKKGCLLAIAIPCIVLIGLIGEIFNLWAFTYCWHQKLTVSIETPQGIITGYGVNRAAAEPDANFRGRFHRVKIYGEAIVVELPALSTEKKPNFLFVLLDGQELLASQVYEKELTEEAGEIESTADWASQVDDLVGLPAKAIPSKRYPMLVTFDDINDPASVKRVDPDNLAASFGEGYALQSITLEITGEPVTSGRVESVLGWIWDLRTRLKPTEKKFAKDYTVEENLGPADFITPYRRKTD